jgi:hypothetical protein
MDSKRLFVFNVKQSFSKIKIDMDALKLRLSKHDEAFKQLYDNQKELLLRVKELENKK